MALDPAPIRDTLADTGGTPSRSWVAWFEAVRKAIASASGMIYPGAGLAKSTGAAWAASVTDNSTAWNSTSTTVSAGSGSWNGAAAHKTTEDAINGLVKVDGAGHYSAVTDNSSAWTHASSAVFNALDYGFVALPYNPTYCGTPGSPTTAPIKAAMAAAAVTNNAAMIALVNTITALAWPYGRTIYFPASAGGAYYFTGTLDISSVLNAAHISIVGDGMYGSKLVQYDASNNVSVPFLLWRSNSFAQLYDISLERLTPDAFGVFPSHVSGNWGVSTIEGSWCTIRRVRIIGFHDDGLHMVGPTGPWVIDSPSIGECAGFGIYSGEKTVAPYIGASPTDTFILAGDIHDCYGGILRDGGDSNAMHGTDIELGASARYPCIYERNTGVGTVCQGNTYVDCTCSIGASVSPSCIVYLGDTRPSVGTVIQGGLFAVDSANAAYGIFLGPNTKGISIVGGNWYCTGTSYFGSAVASVRNTSIVNVYTNTAGNGSTFDDIPANLTVSIGGVATTGTWLGPGGLQLANCPTSAAGLPSGCLWNNAGVVNIT